MHLLSAHCFTLLGKDVGWIGLAGGDDAQFLAEDLWLRISWRKIEQEYGSKYRQDILLTQVTHHHLHHRAAVLGGQRPSPTTDPDHDGQRWSYLKDNEDSSLPPTPPHIGHCRSPIPLPCCFYFFYFLRRGICSITIGIIYQVQQYDDITPCRNR